MGDRILIEQFFGKTATIFNYDSNGNITDMNNDDGFLRGPVHRPMEQQIQLVSFITSQLAFDLSRNHLTGNGITIRLGELINRLLEEEDNR